MSYREENGQVVLTMSQEDYELLLLALGFATGAWAQSPGLDDGSWIVALLNRVNRGILNYTPYQVEKNKT